MGLYDTIFVFMDCPYCGHASEFDAQTKDLGRMMNKYIPLARFHKDTTQARVNTNSKSVRVITCCNSIECQFYADRRDILRQGTPSGFGRQFEGIVEIKGGLLIGTIKKIKKRDMLTEADLDKYKEEDPKLFKKLMKKYKHEPIACRRWPI